MNILKQANNSYAITYVTAFYTNTYVIEVLHCTKMCQYTLYIQKWHSTMHIIYILCTYQSVSCVQLLTSICERIAHAIIIHVLVRSCDRGTAIIPLFHYTSHVGHLGGQNSSDYHTSALNFPP